MTKLYIDNLYYEIIKDPRFGMDRDGSICVINANLMELYCSPYWDADSGIQIQATDAEGNAHTITLEYRMTLDIDQDVKNYLDIMSKFLSIMQISHVGNNGEERCQCL
jgi:hypothetical protein